MSTVGLPEPDSALIAFVASRPSRPSRIELVAQHEHWTAVKKKRPALRTVAIRKLKQIDRELRENDLTEGA